MLRIGQEIQCLPYVGFFLKIFWLFAWMFLANSRIFFVDKFMLDLNFLVLGE